MGGKHRKISKIEQKLKEYNYNPIVHGIPEQSELEELADDIKVKKLDKNDVTTATILVSALTAFLIYKGIDDFVANQIAQGVIYSGLALTAGFVDANLISTCIDSIKDYKESLQRYEDLRRR